MTIREAIIEDIDKIHKLGHEVNEFIVSDEVVTFWPKEILVNCVESDSDWIFVAEEKSEILGFIVVNYSETFKKAIIENIFVSPQHRSKGVAKKLLGKVLESVESSGCEYVCALMEDDNQKAIEFYTSNGFNKGRNFAWLDKVLSKEFSKS